MRFFVSAVYEFLIKKNAVYGAFVQVEHLSTVRIYIPKDLRPIEARERCLKTVLEVMRRFPDGPQLLDPEDDMNVSVWENLHTKGLLRLELQVSGLLKAYLIPECLRGPIWASLSTKKCIFELRLAFLGLLCQRWSCLILTYTSIVYFLDWLNTSM